MPQKNNKLSVCIICKNEEDKIETCLSSVQWADEIVVLDSGSTDKTLEIAAQYTDKIFSRTDWAGFGEQRRRAEDLASNDWIFALDSDEVVTQELSDEIINVVKTANNNNVFIVNRLTNFCGQFIYHSGWYPDPIARIYNKKSFRYNSKLVHESLSCKGSETIKLKNDLYHYTFNDLNSYMLKRMRYANEWAKERHANNKKANMLKAITSSIFAFFRHYILRLGILDGKTGFLISVIQMQYTFNKYSLLIQLQETSTKKE